MYSSQTTVDGSPVHNIIRPHIQYIIVTLYGFSMKLQRTQTIILMYLPNLLVPSAVWPNMRESGVFCEQLFSVSEDESIDKSVLHERFNHVQKVDKRFFKVNTVLDMSGEKLGQSIAGSSSS